jgi:hypothetical protein
MTKFLLYATDTKYLLGNVLEKWRACLTANQKIPVAKPVMDSSSTTPPSPRRPTLILSHVTKTGPRDVPLLFAEESVGKWITVNDAMLADMLRAGLIETETTSRPWRPTTRESSIFSTSSNDASQRDASRQSAQCVPTSTDFFGNCVRKKPYPF